MIETNQEFKKFLIDNKKVLKGKARAIARKSGVHFNTVYNYLDGFHPNPETCKLIMDAARSFLPEENN